MSSKLNELVDQLYKTHERMGHLLAEIDAIMSSEPTVGQNANKLLQYFAANWERKYPNQKLVVAGARDMGSLKRLLKTLSAEEIASRTRLYFKRTDRRVVEARHSMPLFIALINELVPPTATPQSPPRSCKHQPTCKTDVEHTSKMLEEQKRPS